MDDWPMRELEGDLLAVLDSYESASTGEKITTTLSAAARMIETMAYEIARVSEPRSATPLILMSQELLRIVESLKIDGRATSTEPTDD